MSVEDVVMQLGSRIPAALSFLFEMAVGQWHDLLHMIDEDDEWNVDEPSTFIKLRFCWALIQYVVLL